MFNCKNYCHSPVEIRIIRTLWVKFEMVKSKNKGSDPRGVERITRTLRFLPSLLYEFESDTITHFQHFGTYIRNNDEKKKIFTICRKTRLTIFEIFFFFLIFN